MLDLFFPIDFLNRQPHFGVVPNVQDVDCLISNGKKDTASIATLAVDPTRLLYAKSANKTPTGVCTCGAFVSFCLCRSLPKMPRFGSILPQFKLAA